MIKNNFWRDGITKYATSGVEANTSWEFCKNYWLGICHFTQVDSKKDAFVKSIESSYLLLRLGFTKFKIFVYTSNCIRNSITVGLSLCCNIQTLWHTAFSGHVWQLIFDVIWSSMIVYTIFKLQWVNPDFLREATLIILLNWIFYKLHPT